MKILIGYYTEKEIEVDDKFLPLEKDEYDEEDCVLLRELANKVDSDLSYPSELCWIGDADGNTILER